ncbi:MAG: GDP-mannose 4,6-dehydratase [Gemmatimonadaceae bacterium]|nr:GDP-mannose 4,6-dehydratase [Gemmatimonadaceae bacterium]
MTRALITGITGQDGSYLAEHLLAEGYEVHGLIRRASTFNTDRIDHLYQDPHAPGATLFLHHADLTDGSGLRHVLESVQPTEVYNLAAQSHVAVSFKQPEYSADVDGLGPLRLLEAIRDVQGRTGQVIRMYQAGTSEMFGGSPPPQSEGTAFYPRSPYGAAKVMAHHLVVNYREAYGLHASNGILFNHESERRGETFVTRKITRAATRIKLGLQDVLYLGNLDAERDWGHAEDYVRAMHLMLQQDEPGDYVIATGESHTVRSFVNKVFAALGLEPERYVRIDPNYYRPTEVDALRGDASRARAALGWEPRVGIDELVRRMVAHDLELAKQELTLRKAGHVVAQRGAAGA